MRSWAEGGGLTRELAIYHQLAERLRTVNFITYGGKADRQYSGELGAIGLLSSGWSRSMWLNCRMLSWRHRATLRRTDIVKTNQISGAEVALWLKSRFGCKLIARCGYLLSLNLERQHVSAQEVASARLTERNAFERADIGVVTTEANFDRVVNDYGVRPESLRVIPNYVEVNRFSPRADRRVESGFPQLTYVGRLSEEKNLEGLLSALSILKERRVEVALSIFGAGPLRSKLEELAEKACLRVEFHGVVRSEELALELGDSDAFVLPSFYEGHPKALLEAMSCGLPCIGTDVEGISAEITHLKSGYLCETSVESLADAVQKVVSDSELRKTMGLGAREHVVSRYSLERVLEQELSVIKEAMAA